MPCSRARCALVYVARHTSVIRPTGIMSFERRREIQRKVRACVGSVEVARQLPENLFLPSDYWFKAADRRGGSAWCCPCVARGRGDSDWVQTVAPASAPGFVRWPARSWRYIRRRGRMSAEGRSDDAPRPHHRCMAFVGAMRKWSENTGRCGHVMAELRRDDSGLRLRAFGAVRPVESRVTV